MMVCEIYLSKNFLKEIILLLRAITLYCVKKKKIKVNRAKAMRKLNGKNKEKENARILIFL